MYQNLWDVAKAGFRGKFTELNAYIEKEERSIINNLSFYIQKLEKKKSKLNPK